MSYIVGVDIGGTLVHPWEGEAFIWLLEFWPATDLEVPDLRHKIVEG